jgi:divalent metal cation (Fe/Co/Zn/Cd) transporter
MASVLQIAPPNAIRRIQRVQTVTIAWMSVEAAVSLFAAWRAHSHALLAFGGDSAVELLSAVVVLWRFRAGAAHGDAERWAARAAGTLLFLPAAFVAILSVMSLLGYGANGYRLGEASVRGRDGGEWGTNSLPLSNPPMR